MLGLASGWNTNFGLSVSPAGEVPFVISLSTLSVVTDLAVTASLSFTARSLIVTTPVFSLIVTPSEGALVKLHVLPVFVAVIFCVELFGCL